MLQEFKAFAVRGNVIDLAVGVIIGGAFGKIVDSMVGDLIMPMVSALIGRLDFSNLFIALGAVPAGTGSTLDALRKAGVPVLAFIIFMLIRQINRLKGEHSPPETPAVPNDPPEEVLLLRQIRDNLQNKA